MTSLQSNIASLVRYGQIPPIHKDRSILLFPPSCIDPGYALSGDLQAQIICWPQSTADINSASKSVNT